MLDRIIFPIIEHSFWVWVLVAVFLLKSAFAVRGLTAAARAVQRALDAGDAAGARVALRSLVSRDTAGLMKCSHL